ncbi:hypothetical protein [Desulfosporosinus sp. OT]|uniref:hypothetical protein n=1 Tax=Desulfosporosinus sp. OT TaxID=913865 RepID=UPI000223A3D8|nr:hypothetical protein [Desulfosporosinus sp. OT]EGW41358.1 hypothetical protein DOT_0712 [Desulfosporosinus sp. OT]
MEMEMKDTRLNKAMPCLPSTYQPRFFRLLLTSCPGGSAINTVRSPLRKSPTLRHDVTLTETHPRVSHCPLASKVQSPSLARDRAQRLNDYLVNPLTWNWEDS